MRPTIAERHLHRKVLAWFLDFVYPIPSEIEGTDYAFNTDIFEMTEAERRRDYERIRLRLLLDPDPTTWLLARLQALADMEAVSHE